MRRGSVLQGRLTGLYERAQLQMPFGGSVRTKSISICTYKTRRILTEKEMCLMKKLFHAIGKSITEACECYYHTFIQM